MAWILAIFADERGQDLVEYTLLVAFMCLCVAALMLHNQAAIEGIWAQTKDNLDRAGEESF